MLSRKGFDSACGGVPSPILPDGTMVSLPIPRLGSPTRYGEIAWTSADQGATLGDLVYPLTRGRIGKGHPAHLDPDLDPGSLPRPPGWRPGFGQVGAALSHLRRRGVGPGDLFLFFGWFREVEQDPERGWCYRAGAPDRHILFGWLQVEHVDCVEEDAAAILRRRPWLLRHPHLAGEWPDANAIYSAPPHLTVEGLARRLPGGGRFTRLRDALVLTDRAAPGRTHWRLPAAFWPGLRQALSYHGDPTRWRQAGEHVLLRSVAQGQEFVLDLDEYPEAKPWLVVLFETALVETAVVERKGQIAAPGGGSLISGIGSSLGGTGIGDGGSSMGDGIPGSRSGG